MKKGNTLMTVVLSFALAAAASAVIGSMIGKHREKERAAENNEAEWEPDDLCCGEDCCCECCDEKCCEMHIIRYGSAEETEEDTDNGMTGQESDH